jgi:hypothetical protein
MEIRFFNNIAATIQFSRSASIPVGSEQAGHPLERRCQFLAFGIIGHNN